MDVDACERRPGGGGRRGHETTMMKPLELYQIEEPATPVQRELLPLTCIQSHRSAAETRPLGPPWPEQIDWRELVRRIGG